MRRRCRLALIAALPALLATPAASSHAGERPVVAVTAPDAADPLLRESDTRLAAELRAAGFDVVREAGARSDGAIASFALARAPDGAAAVDVSVTDRLTHKTSTRRIEAAGPGELAPATLAIRAVELLRASLVELGAEGQPAQPVPPAVETLVAPLREPRTRSPIVGPAVVVGAGALFGRDGLAPAALPVLRASVALTTRWALRLTVAAPGLAETISAAAGTATVRQELAAADVVCVLRPNVHARLVPIASLGFGAYHLHVRGSSAGPPFVARDDDAWAALATLGVGLAVRLGGRAAVIGEASAVVTAPGAAVDVGGAVVGHAGRPSGLLSLGVAWAL